MASFGGGGRDGRRPRSLARACGTAPASPQRFTAGRTQASGPPPPGTAFGQELEQRTARRRLQSGGYCPYAPPPNARLRGHPARPFAGVLDPDVPPGGLTRRPVGQRVWYGGVLGLQLGRAGIPATSVRRARLRALGQQDLEPAPAVRCSTLYPSAVPVPVGPTWAQRPVARGWRGEERGVPARPRPPTLKLCQPPHGLEALLRREHEEPLHRSGVRHGGHIGPAEPLNR